jgi:hypothetical protein
MNRFSLVLGSSLLFTGTAHAQLGVRAGGNLAGFTTSTNNGVRTSTGSQPGYQMALFYQQPLTRHLSLVPEVQYSDERLTMNRSSLYGATYHATYRARYKYLSVPVLLRATWGRVYGEVGPQIGVMVGGREVGEVSIGQTSFEVNRATTDPNQGYRRVDAGPCLGVGVQLLAGLGLNVRAYQGLASLTHDGGANIAHLYRRSLQASLIYQLRMP